MEVSMTETVAEKSRRYLSEARLTVTQVDGDRVSAVCRGAGQVYDLGHTPGRGWWCTCPARGDCAHLTALQAVTVRRAASR
jgi:uncharacterized Zn finger protein